MSTSRSTAEAESGSPSGALHVDFFEAPLSPELWEAYERATRSYACTRTFLEYFEQPAGTSLALVRSSRAGEDRAAFLYRLRPGGTALVLGRYAATSADALRAFADAVFTRHSQVRRVDTSLIDAIPDGRAIGRPVLAVREATDMRIALPPSVAEYERTLGKDFLSRIRYCERRLARDRPATRLSTREGAEIPRAWVEDVIRLNHERMASKNTRSVFDEHYQQGILRVVRAHGAVTILHDDSRTFAGVIDVYCGSQAFGWVTGYDEAYGKYCPGRLCQVAAIRHSIGRGVRTFHLLLGESSYKRGLGGNGAPVNTYLVLRTWASLRPGDVARLCRMHLARLGRRSGAGAARAARRFVRMNTTPVRSLARSIARRARRLVGP